MLPAIGKRILHKVADIVESRDDQLALLESWDSGPAITQAKGQARRAAENFRFFTDLIVAEHDNVTKVPGRQINYVNRKPKGVSQASSRPGTCPSCRSRGSWLRPSRPATPSC